ncbi:hypothetical protein FKM82_021898 [Ascaphus truei]
MIFCDTIRSMAQIACGQYHKPFILLSIIWLNGDGWERHIHWSCGCISGPGIIRNLNLKQVSTSSAVLEWESPQEGASGYKVIVIRDPPLDFNVTLENADLSQLIPGNYYTAFISAYNESKEGDALSISFNAVPGKVQNVTALNINPTSVALSWQPPEGNASSYGIQMLQDPTFNMTVTSNSVTIGNLTPGNDYTFLVSAVVGENHLPLQGNSSDISIYTSECL